MVGLSHSAAHFFKFILVLVLFNIATTMWNVSLRQFLLHYPSMELILGRLALPRRHHLRYRNRHPRLIRDQPFPNGEQS